MIRLGFTARRLSAGCLTVALLAALPCSPLLAAETLPGVVQGEPIVKPQPPEPAREDSSEKEPVRVGDWDVRISGSVTVDVGVGALRRPSR